MAYVFVKNVNPHVEEQKGYSADSVKVELDEATFRVKAYPVDTNGNQIAGSANLVDKPLADLTKASAYYAEIIHQLEQGDVIRNV